MNNKFESIRNQKGMFFMLKEHGYIQSLLIDSLMTKYNCSIEDLALILNANAENLQQVCSGQATLSEKHSVELVSLFYMLSLD